MKPWRELCGVLLMGLALGPARAEEPAQWDPREEPLEVKPLEFAPVQAGQVRELLDQLRNGSYRQREQAHETLKAMGPAAAIHLAPYREDPDPEVRRRMEDVFPSVAWALRGAVITGIHGADDHEQLGLRVGDVILRIDETDIAGAEDIEPFPFRTLYTIIILRDGQLVSVKAWFSDGNIQAEPWRADRGGPALAQAYEALVVREQVDEALDLFEQALDVGLDAPGVLRLAAGLAEKQCDHARAMRFYRVYRRILPDDTDDALEDFLDGGPDKLPYSALHAAWVLERLANEPYSAELACQAEAFFARSGRNVPMLRELAARPLPRDEARYVGPVLASRLALAAAEGRYEDAAELVEAMPREGLGHAFMPAVRALLQLGRHEDAVALLERTVEEHALPNSNMPPLLAGDLLGTLLAAGQGRLALRTWRVAERLAPRSSGGAWELPAYHYLRLTRRVAMERLLERLVEREEAQAQQEARAGVSSRYPSRRNPVSAFLLELAVLLPEDRPEWVQALSEEAGYAFEKIFPLTLYDLRHGRADEAAARLDQAAEQLARYRSLDLTPVRAAIEWQRANAERLAGDRAELAGATYVYDGPGGGQFVVRWDGAVFFIEAGPDGAVHRTTGLDPDLALHPMLHEGIVTQPTGTLLVHTQETYLYDPAAHAWRPTGLSQGRSERMDRYATPAGPRFVVWAMANLPPHARRLLNGGASGGGWSYWWVQGDRLFAVHGDGQQPVRDCGQEIARQLGRPEPVRMYYPAWVGQRRLLPTEAGLWELAEDGTLSRIELPLPDNDVMIVPLHRPGTGEAIGFGVAPQQGGQVVRLDAQTGQFELTAGFNGLGPRDSLAWTLAQGPAVEPLWQALGEQRRAAEARP